MHKGATLQWKILSGHISLFPESKFSFLLSLPPSLLPAFFKDKVSCSLNCPHTSYVAKDDLTSDPPASNLNGEIIGI